MVRVVEVNVDGRINKTRVSYKNADEVISREVLRNVKDLVLIQGTNEVDFNTYEHYLVSTIQAKYL